MPSVRIQSILPSIAATQYSSASEARGDTPAKRTGHLGTRAVVRHIAFRSSFFVMEGGTREAVLASASCSVLFKHVMPGVASSRLHVEETEFWRADARSEVRRLEQVMSEAVWWKGALLRGSWGRVICLCNWWVSSLLIESSLLINIWC